jgi:O-antigen/teichoic acid export membrane protein
MPDNLKQRAVRGVLWFGISRVVVQLITWVVTLAVARILSPSDYGLFGMTLIYTGLIDYFNDMGLGAAIIRCKDLTEEQLSSLFWFTNVVGLFFFGLAIATAPLAAKFFQQPLLIPLICVVSVNFIITSLQQVPWNLLTRAIDFKKRSIAETAGNLFGGLVTIVLAYRDYGVWALAWGFLTRSIIVTAAVFILARWLPQLCFNWAKLRPLVNFAAAMTAGRIVYYLHSASPIFIIGKFLGEKVLGYYSLASRLSWDAGDRVLSVIIQVAFPVFSEIQDDLQRLKAVFLQSAGMVCALIYPFYGGLIVLGDDAIPLLLGQKWTPIIVPFKFLAGAGFFWTLHAMMGPLVLAKNRPKAALSFNLLCLGILPASFYVGSKFGLLGVCVAWVSVYPMLVLFWVSKGISMIHCTSREFWKALRPSVMGTVSMLIATSFLIKAMATLPPILRMFMVISVGATVYIVVFSLLFPRPLKDLIKLLRSPRSYPSVA